MSIYSATTIQVPDSKGFLLNFTIDNQDSKSNDRFKMLRDVLRYDFGGFENLSLPVVTSHKEIKYAQLELSFNGGYVYFAIKEMEEVIILATTDQLEFLRTLDKALSIAG